MTSCHSSVAVASCRLLGYGGALVKVSPFMKLVSAWLKIPFWQRVLAGFVLGALAGWAFGPAADPDVLDHLVGLSTRYRGA